MNDTTQTEAKARVRDIAVTGLMEVHEYAQTLKGTRPVIESLNDIAALCEIPADEMLLAARSVEGLDTKISSMDQPPFDSIPNDLLMRIRFLHSNTMLVQMLVKSIRNVLAALAYEELDRLESEWFTTAEEAGNALHHATHMMATLKFASETVSNIDVVGIALRRACDPVEFAKQLKDLEEL